MGTVGKKRLPVLENISFCKVLYAIGCDSLKAQDIARRINLFQTGVIRNLNILVNDNFLLINKVKKRKYYEVNFQKIIDECLSYIENKLNTSKQDLDCLNRISNGNYSFYRDYKSIKKRLRNNPYLLEYFRTLFHGYHQINQEKTLIECFENTIIAFSHAESLWPLYSWDRVQMTLIKVKRDDQIYLDITKLSEILRSKNDVLIEHMVIRGLKDAHARLHKEQLFP